MTPGASAEHPDTRRRWRRGAGGVAAVVCASVLIGWASTDSEASRSGAGGEAAEGTSLRAAGTTATWQPSSAGLIRPLPVARTGVTGPLAVPPGPRAGTGSTQDAPRPQESDAVGDPLRSIVADLRDSLEKADEDERIEREFTSVGTDLRDDAKPLPARCTAEPDESRHRVCVVGDDEGARTAVLIGSSHVMMWIPGLRAVAESEGVRLLVYVKYGCSPYTFTMRRGLAPWAACEKWRDWAVEDIVEESPQLVLAGSHAWVDIASPSGSGLALPQFDDAWSGGVSGLVEALSPVVAAGGRVTVLGDTTRRSKDPGGCTSRPRARYDRCEQRITADTVRLNDLTRAAAEGAGASYYDPGELVCLDARCPVLAGGRFVFRDRLGHVSATYSEHVGPALAEGVGLTR